MNTKDALLQKHFPTVPVPKYEDLPRCEVGKTRLLMGQGGLYIETRQPWGHLIENLWESPRPLPYGIVEAVDTFENTFQLCMDELRSLLPYAEQYAVEGQEWAAWIIHSPTEARRFKQLHLLAEERSAAHIRSKLPSLKETQSIVVDIHSHGKLEPFFSATDDEDDKGGVRICVVIGGYTGPDTFKAKARYVVEGFFFERDLA